MITSEPQVPTAVPNETVVPPSSDVSYLEQMEQALEVAERSIANAKAVDQAPASAEINTNEVTEEKQTALAVSVVIPVYNERETIAEIVERIRAVGIHHEIIIVDDFSLDGTRDVLLELAREPDVHLLMHGYNRGKGAALRTAFAMAEGDVILIQDADLEYDPADYSKLLAPIERGESDVVYGSRFLENAHQDPSRLHRFGNWLLTACSNLFTGQKLTDMETCYKAFRSEILSTLRFEQNRFGFEPEITAKISRLGYNIVEVPISYHARGYEEGKKIGLGDALSAIRCILKYR